ncbi:PqqD family protein [Micromonospora ureilytica]|uniref:PqqD family protein n=1 Tax=Micromonospora ureilytica TaxID=709868 RepID=UPI002E1678A5|nr:PqqD family protein [Micromonospora ureilytica]
MLRLSSVPRRHRLVRMRKFAGSLLIAAPDPADNIELNDSGTLMFRAIDGKRSVAEIGELVAATFGIPVDEIMEDVVEFVADLGERRIVDLLGASDGPVAPLPGPTSSPATEPAPFGSRDATTPTSVDR